MNQSFSKHHPDVQVAWDAAALKNYQFCPRYYKLTNLDGWRGGGTDVEFGGYVASGFERFQKARISGKSIEDALVEVVRWALEATYFEAHRSIRRVDDGYEDKYEPDAQWGGRYETMWKCEGTKPYKNAKGNRAKCPFALEKIWMPGEAPDTCGECGSNIRVERRYLPVSNAKNRQTLVRTLVWYGLSQPEELNDGYRPYVFPDGLMAVELSDKMPLPWRNSFGEQYLLTWHFDYVGQYINELYITDNKTTTKTLNGQYFDSFQPDTQFDTYALVGKVAYPELPIVGVMIDAVQTLVGGNEFAKHPYRYDDTRVQEHLDDLEWWIRAAEEHAIKGYWPMNKRNCWLCPLKKVCSLPPDQREGYLKSNFTKGPRWDALHER